MPGPEFTPKNHPEKSDMKFSDDELAGLVAGTSSEKSSTLLNYGFPPENAPRLSENSPPPYDYAHDRDPNHDTSVMNTLKLINDSNKNPHIQAIKREQELAEIARRAAEPQDS